MSVLVYRSASALPIFYATSGYWQDIQDAVDEASRNGGKADVAVPEGDFNFVNVNESWTGARVTVLAGINIFGAPTERTSGLAYNGKGSNPNDQVVQWRTVLRLPWDVPGDPYGTWSGTVSSIPIWFRMSGNGDVNKPSRFSDIKLVGYRSINPDSHMQTLGVRKESVANYRVDHCYFENVCGGAIMAIGTPTTSCCGVTDHCYLRNEPAIYVSLIQNCDVDYGVAFYRATSSEGTFAQLWEPNILNVVGKYTGYSHYVEDCNFGKWRHCTASNNGAHYVIRYCTFDGGYGSTIDAHGTYNVVGTRAIEIYSNVFKNQVGSGGSIIYWRGGGGVFFNNAIDSTFGAYILVAEGTVEACWPHDAYIWNNDPHTISVTVSKEGADGLMHPALDIDFFTYAMSDYTPYPYPHPIVAEEPPPIWYITPFLEQLEEGVYEISLPSIITDASNTYNFKQWEDGSTNPTRTVNLTSDMSLMATYELATPETVTLRGTVKDAKTDQPIADAVIAANGASTNSLQDGTYEIAGLEPKQYTVTISKLGYNTQSLAVDATGGGTINLPEVKLASTPKVSSIAPLTIGAVLIIGSTYL